MNEVTEVIKYIFIGLTALGGGVGIGKLLTVRKQNKRLDKLADKTGVEATAIFSDSVLKMLQHAQRQAVRAETSAAKAVKEAQRCQEELAMLRRWIIEQGLTPPNLGDLHNG